MKPTKEDMDMARKVFHACIVANFCPCGCPSHKLLSIPGSVVDSVAQAISNQREEDAEIAERYRSPYTLKASENALSPEEVRFQEYIRKEIAAAIRRGKP